MYTIIVVYCVLYRRKGIRFGVANGRERRTTTHGITRRRCDNDNDSAHVRIRRVGDHSGGAGVRETIYRRKGNSDTLPSRRYHH